jgi:hypothetical protein
MRGPILLFLSVLALVATAACERRDAAPDAADPAADPALPLRPPAAQAAGGAGAFLVMRGPDTLLLERYQRSATRLTGELLDHVGGARLEYAALVGTDDRLERIEAHLYPAGAERPALGGVVLLRQDSLVVEVYGHDTVVRHAAAAEPGTFALIGESTAQLEQLLRFARERNGAAAVIPVFLVGQAGGGVVDALDRAHVRWLEPDSAVVTVDERVVRVGLDDDARIIGGVETLEGIRIFRHDP